MSTAPLPASWTTTGRRPAASKRRVSMSIIAIPPESVPQGRQELARAVRPGKGGANPTPAPPGRAEIPGQGTCRPCGALGNGEPPRTRGLRPGLIHVVPAGLEQASFPLLPHREPGLRDHPLDVPHRIRPLMED